MGRNYWLPNPHLLSPPFIVTNSYPRYSRLLQSKGPFLSLFFLLPVGWIKDIMAGALEAIVNY